MRGAIYQMIVGIGVLIWVSLGFSTVRAVSQSIQIKARVEKSTGQITQCPQIEEFSVVPPVSVRNARVMVNWCVQGAESVYVLGHQVPDCGSWAVLPPGEGVYSIKLVAKTKSCKAVRELDLVVLSESLGGNIANTVGAPPVKRIVPPMGLFLLVSGALALLQAVLVGFNRFYSWFFEPPAFLNTWLGLKTIGIVYCIDSEKPCGHIRVKFYDGRKLLFSVLADTQGRIRVPVSLLRRFEGKVATVKISGARLLGPKGHATYLPVEAPYVDGKQRVRVGEEMVLNVVVKKCGFTGLVRFALRVFLIIIWGAEVLWFGFLSYIFGYNTIYALYTVVLILIGLVYLLSVLIDRIRYGTLVKAHFAQSISLYRGKRLVAKGHTDMNSRFIFVVSKDGEYLVKAPDKTWEVTVQIPGGSNIGIIHPKLV